MNTAPEEKWTSDWHLHHRKVAAMRGFEDRDAYAEWLIARWNAAVKPDDIIWVLGDVGLGSTTRILELAARMNGRKQLVTGNHDAPWPGNTDARKCQKRWLEVFESVQPFAVTKVGGQPVLMSHFPYEGDHTDVDREVQFRLRDEGAWLLHGHLHTKERRTGRKMVHVGMDAWDCLPATADDIANVMKEVWYGN